MAIRADDDCDHCRLADISAKSLLLQVVRQDAVKNDRPVEQIAGQGGSTRQQAGRPKHYVHAYRHRPPTKRRSTFKLSFAKTPVSRDDVIEALEAILREAEIESIPRCIVRGYNGAALPTAQRSRICAGRSIPASVAERLVDQTCGERPSQGACGVPSALKTSRVPDWQSVEGTG